MTEKTGRGGLLDNIYESITQGKLTPEQALDFFSKMDIDKREVLTILSSLGRCTVTVAEAKKKIAFLVAEKTKSKSSV